jgi:hypothetical protein
MSHPPTSVFQLIASVPALWVGLAMSILGLALVLQDLAARLGVTKGGRTHGWEAIVLGLGSTVSFWAFLLFLHAHLS